ncbi:hypothetical protein Are01nite_79830 [Actinoplanes regularis]|nr:hypothetical protein Are01nite_79830 [Actinoplanes regularis]
MYGALTVVPSADAAAITDTALLTGGDQRILATRIGVEIRAGTEDPTTTQAQADTPTSATTGLTATTGAGNVRIAEFQAYTPLAAPGQAGSSARLPGLLPARTPPHSESHRNLRRR